MSAFSVLHTTIVNILLKLLQIVGVGILFSVNCYNPFPELSLDELGNHLDAEWLSTDHRGPQLYID